MTPTPPGGCSILNSSFDPFLGCIVKPQHFPAGWGQDHPTYIAAESCSSNFVQVRRVQAQECTARPDTYTLGWMAVTSMGTGFVLVRRVQALDYTSAPTHP